MNIAYLLPIPVRAFFDRSEDDADDGVREAPVACVVALVITALGSLALFLNPDPLYALMSQVATP
jgi:multicomponent Na+:H+ antiporter subunit D